MNKKLVSVLEWVGIFLLAAILAVCIAIAIPSSVPWIIEGAQRILILLRNILSFAVLLILLVVGAASALIGFIWPILGKDEKRLKIGLGLLLGGLLLLLISFCLGSYTALGNWSGLILH